MRSFLLIVAAYSAFAAEPVYLVLLKGASALGFYTPSGKLAASVPVGKHPHEMVFSADRRLVYTTDNGTMRMEHPGAGNNTVSIVDVIARRKMAEIPLGRFHRPHGIAIDHRTGRLLVSTEAPDRLLLIDANRRSVIRDFDNGGRQPHMVTFGPDGKWAYVSNTGAGNVAAIRLDDGERKIIATEPRPQGSVLSKDGRELYVACSGGSGIVVIDPTKNALIAHIPTGKGPNRIALTPDGSTLVYSISTENKIGFADPKTRRQTDYVLLPGTPVSCTLSQDGSLAFASAEAKDVVYVVSVREKKIVSEIRTAEGAAPDPVLELR
jgi:YVTN family beta-propeller protein